MDIYNKKPFRAKTTYDAWRYGWIFKAGKKYYIVDDTAYLEQEGYDGSTKDELVLGYQHFELVIDESIGQFITNVDNQDIYEGDIIEETSHGSQTRIFIAEDIRTFTREFDKAHHNAIWKVIGNKFDNPDIMTLKNLFPDGKNKL